MTSEKDNESRTPQDAAPKGHVPKTSSQPKSGLATDFCFNRVETEMGDKGSKDKGKREQQKKALLSPQEKRKVKQAKKNK